MSANEQLRQVYTEFYDQREVLADAPVLSQDPVAADFDFEKADKELSKVVSYLMGVPDIQKESFEHAIQIIQEHYDSQPEWQELLVKYFEYGAEKEKEELQAQEDALIKEIEEFTKKLFTEE